MEYIQKDQPNNIVLVAYLLAGHASMHCTVKKSYIVGGQIVRSSTQFFVVSVTDISDFMIGMRSGDPFPATFFYAPCFRRHFFINLYFYSNIYRLRNTCNSCYGYLGMCKVEYIFSIFVLLNLLQ